VNAPPIDSTALRALPDTLYVLDKTHGPSFWWNVATLLTVPLGWFVADYFARSAQKAHYRDRLILEAAKSVSDDLIRFTRWLIERSALVRSLDSIDGIDDERVRRIQKQTEVPAAIDWVLSVRANERVLRPMVASLYADGKKLLDAKQTAGNHVEMAFGNIAACRPAADELVELAKEVERIRDAMMEQVTERIFRKPWWRRAAAALIGRTRGREVAAGGNESVSQVTPLVTEPESEEGS
jgi:hypothetical protein